MIIVWGSIETTPEHLAEVTRLSLEHVQRSRKEPGCISHSVQTDVENPCRLIFFEQWEDQQALQTHFAVPASGEFVTNVTKLATSQPLIRLFQSNALN